MMYQNDFLAVLKVDGKILREDKNTVCMPFGSEYSILLKNLYSRRAVVSISIDGQDILNGEQLVVRANSELELERFLENMDEGNRFKFIQKTKNIQEHRGDKVDDGIIRIEFQFEAPKYEPVYLTKPLYDPPKYNYNDYTTTTCYSSNNISPSTTNINYRGDSNGSHSGDVNHSCLRGMNLSSTQTSVTNSMQTSNIDFDMSDGQHLNSFSPVTVDSMDVKSFIPNQDEGITVKGSKSTQKFATVSVGELEHEKHVITLQLKGFTNTGKEVEKPVTVKTKKKCQICGRVNKGSSKFCAECGTFLE